MAWLRMRRGRMVWLAAVMFALPLVYVAGLAIAGHWGRGLFDDVCELYFRFLVPFVPALTASAAVAEEIENKTFTFVFARPAPRGSLVLGKLAAATLPSIAVVVPSLVMAWLVAELRFPGRHRRHVAAPSARGVRRGRRAVRVRRAGRGDRHAVLAPSARRGARLPDADRGGARLGADRAEPRHRRLAPAQHRRAAAAGDGVHGAERPRWASAIAAIGVSPALVWLTCVGVNGAEYRTDR